MAVRCAGTARLPARWRPGDAERARSAGVPAM